MDKEAFRIAFKQFLGESQYEKFVERMARRNRMHYWQEIAWEKFQEANPDLFSECVDPKALINHVMFCSIHNTPLMFGPMTFISDQVYCGYDRDDPHRELFPYSPLREILPPSATLGYEKGPIGYQEEGEEPFFFTTKTTNEWFCPMCREARVEYDRSK